MAADASHDDPRWKQIADIAASGPLDYYPDPGIDGERAAIEQDCVEADRQQALKEANRQHQEDLDAWNALGRVKKAITRQPERQEPEDPAPPTQARIDEYRQETLIRRVVQKIREVLNYFLNQELVPADRVAARAFEEVSRARTATPGARPRPLPRPLSPCGPCEARFQGADPRSTPDCKGRGRRRPELPPYSPPGVPQARPSRAADDAARYATSRSTRRRARR